MELTGADFDFSALNEVDDTVREEILWELEPETVAEGVRELESDDAVELLEGLNEEDQEEILEKLPPSERNALERSLEYPENSAGRRMQTEFVAVPPDWTVGQAIDYLRNYRRRGRRDRARGGPGPEGAGRRHQRRRIIRQRLDHRQGPLQLAAGQSGHRLSGVLGAGPVRSRAAKNGGA